VRLKNKVVIITGASSGIGASLALRLALKKARIVLAARSTKPLEELALKVRAAGAEALVVPTDVTDAASVRHMVAQANQRFGPIDVLVNNAGYGVYAPIQKASADDLTGMLKTNLIGVAHCVEAVLPQMLARRKGQIVNVASVAGLVASANLAYYSTTKFALVGLSKSMRLDLAGSGVRVATICPGPVDTPFNEQADNSMYGFWTRLMGMRTPIEVAEVIEQAIVNQLNGEKITPAWGYPLIRITQLFPRTSELLQKIIR
jgi:uncharacterized protein